MKNLKNAQIKEGNVSHENIQLYKDYGYLVASNLISKTEIKELKEETSQIFRGKKGNIDGLVTINESDSDETVLKKYVAIHFSNKISSVIKEYLSHKKVTEILKSIVSPNVKCMQSMLFVKAPRKQGQSWHQDEYFIPTRDKSLIGVWIAIDDAISTNVKFSY